MEAVREVEIEGQGLSFLKNENLKLLLFSGKGGTGKTTMAAATALYLARSQKKRILVVSTDPAHSLSDSYDQPIGDQLQPIQGVSNLQALEMDARKRLEAFKRKHEGTLKLIADRGTYFDAEDIGDFWDLSLPGVDELMGVIELAEIVKGNDFDLVIVDMAPTGHALRLLTLPRLMERWLHLWDLMLEKHRFMASTFGRYTPDEADAFLEEMSDKLDGLRKLLCKDDVTEFVPVTAPRPMEISETERLLKELEALELGVNTLVVNKVFCEKVDGCPFCQMRLKAQAPHLDTIRERFSDYDLVFAPLLPYKVRGQKALRHLVDRIEGHPSSPFSTSTLGMVPKMDKDKERTAVVPSFPSQTLILFGGKGGVGKTTMAAATAVHMAQREKGRDVLLFSTDPAHSLSDSLEQQIGKRVTRVSGVDGLFALEMDAESLLEELKHVYMTEIDEAFDAILGTSLDTSFDRQIMEELITVTPPGVDELLGLLKIMEFIDEGSFDRYVLDMAPTGHALRFLEMPHMMRQWLITFFRLILKYKNVALLPRVTQLLRKKSKQLRKLRRLLSDAEHCHFVAVTLPEAMVVRETKRLLHQLEELALTCRYVIVNKLIPPGECSFCTLSRRAQEPQLCAIDDLGCDIVAAPLFPQGTKGIPSLSRMAEVIYVNG